ncbi:CRISPR system precrRNA processing endoribonuclease RAMP protein Cas6 [Natrarchaeobius halalkaliphilus]|uniref:CRISPR system precrRNA processing endoribonuclease RAMP protein Cas6 n=1 Tax=Natrarchaeobius halalkaliphilus TaxID=1679091 RepID=A0A3N6LSR6_9EURY|nr:CRISPR system precrRNA processing endoribonuclease RAMP protein Cas6 [Natrarchaeobius halalkaliphilus]RQG93013.1 CRISPR system precrRNA processing endoribonuclease RAMP protein Cas6 [Natrarchaeobius halalkaliphilus]
MAQQSHSSARTRRVEIRLRPEERFAVPLSDGYSVYSALLSALESADADASARVHDSQIGSLHTSGLQGVFGDSDRSHHKLALPNEEYRLSIGITDPEDEAIFQALVAALVLEGDSIELTNGSLRVDSFESENSSHQDLLETAASFDDPSLEFDFETATCIEEAGSVTTMFPVRTAVFSSLLGKWNRTAPENLEVDVSRDAIASSVIEKPDDSSYRTHSVLVNRVEDDDGNPRPIFRQGFSGRCTYAFKDASESVENALSALALFAEYSGVGSAVARGCGNVNIQVVDE